MRSIRLSALLATAGALLLAQHGYTPADAEEGNSCSSKTARFATVRKAMPCRACSLARGKFRHASSDEDLGQIIKNGIPGTAMPPGNFHEHQITALIAYLRSMSDFAIRRRPLLWATPRAEKAILEGRGRVPELPRVNGQGSYVGPELTDIGAIRRIAQLQRSLS